MNLLDETKYIMKKYNVFAAKRFGQNFLIDDSVVAEIVSASSITKDDLVIEIGPGLGTLTKELLEKAGKVIAIEIDKKMIDILNDRFGLYDNFEIIENDVLKVDLRTIIENNVGVDSECQLSQTKVVANLPYYITTPIIMKLLEDKLSLKSITVMVQKEVADRLTCKPGSSDSGAITYGIRYYTEPRKIIEVPREAFLPAPEVDSTVIKLEVLEKLSVVVESEEALFKVIKVAFMQRRKTLLNGLSSLDSKDNIQKMLLELGFDLKIRAERLTLEDFARIANYM
ncbi:MAG: 16S rRNA (adenine(1518)-N(6)/adenine(1519)-N(6))-dimethyltransferase RsmA [Oscillospiraceae bacterium]|nr:16S rRNA (adenine(1518)-N(6)/adenine(1519)-N(6))-dimethyltransferase RsmA [Oscillospiraceae bacterium]